MDYANVRAGEAGLEARWAVREYDIRRPLTVTGTNLLGLVKHNGVLMEAGSFGEVFARPFPGTVPHWNDAGAAEENTEHLWVCCPRNARGHPGGLLRSVCEHSDKTIDALPIDAPGRVPW